MGSCHTEHDEGYVNKVIFSASSIIPIKGLYFEMYWHDAAEKYRIEYTVSSRSLLWL